MRNALASQRTVRASALGACIILAAQSASAAAPRQSPESILTAARQFLVEQIGPRDGKLRIKMSRIDPRLRLPACREGLNIETPRRGNLLGKVSVRISCHEALNRKPWSIFVSAKVTLLQAVYVAQGHIPRGTSITSKQIRLDERDVGEMRRGYFSHLEEIQGMIARQTIAPGQVLSSYLIKPPTLVKRGQTIAITARQGELIVRMQGKALSSGAAGERIQVRNLSSKRVVEGLITPSGEVAVSL